jgi:hypothetical protein
MTFWVAGAVVGSSLIGSMGASSAADTAAQASGAASAASIAEQRRQYDQNRADQAPYLAAGTSAVNRLGAGVGYGGEFGSTRPFDFQYDQNADPGAAFRMSEGIKALDRSAASRGGLLSGATLKGVQRYGSDLGSQEYNNAFNRYVTGFNANTGERNALYNRLAGVAGTGQTATGQIGAQGTNMASNIGASLMTSAANTGNAAMAAAGQRNSAFGGAANVLGRMYGGYGRGSNPYANAAMANQQYGAENVYGFGGGGTIPAYTGEQ